MTNACPYGFRILGATSEPRRLVDAGAALAGYAGCDPRSEPHKESYLSAFCFGEDFRRLLTETGSTAGFAGPCWSPWLWFDLDSEDLHYAHKDAGALAAFLVERYGVQPGELLLFFSGSKGFHVGLPTALWSPAPSADFHRTARRFAEHAAELASVTIDVGVYDRVRAFRAPNSRHPKTGLHKRPLSFDELTGISLDRILELARQPAPFTLPEVTGTSDQADADWQAAAALVEQEAEAKAVRRAAGNGAPTLNRATLDFIRHGADQGDRHRLLFSAAANLAEFGCPPALAVALLEEPSLDSGLPPKEVRRQIDCGLAAVGSPSPIGATSSGADVSAAAATPPVDTPAPPNETPTPTADELRAALAALWTRSGPTPTPASDPGPHPSPLPQAGEGTKNLPPLPPPLRPLPPRAVGTGSGPTPCRCGCADWVDVAISGGRTRRECRACGRFLGFGKWYTEGDTP